jgi:hypothetical protein
VIGKRNARPVCFVTSNHAVAGQEKNSLVVLDDAEKDRDKRVSLEIV